MPGGVRLAYRQLTDRPGRRRIELEARIVGGLSEHRFVGSRGARQYATPGPAAASGRFIVLLWLTRHARRSQLNRPASADATQRPPCTGLIFSKSPDATQSRPATYKPASKEREQVAW